MTGDQQIDAALILSLLVALASPLLLPVPVPVPVPAAAPARAVGLTAASVAKLQVVVAFALRRLHARWLVAVAALVVGLGPEQQLGFDVVGLGVAALAEDSLVVHYTEDRSPYQRLEHRPAHRLRTCR